jgi:hypothetical protein
MFAPMPMFYQASYFSFKIKKCAEEENRRPSPENDYFKLCLARIIIRIHHACMVSTMPLAPFGVLEAMFANRNAWSMDLVAF